jgi:broad specificity phosphatase PhoE
MKIYFAAHATTKDNETKVASGWSDAELSDLGIQQARELGETFKNIKLDIVCCSDLRRAVDTVKIAFENKYQVIADQRLRELNYGDFNGKPSAVVEPMKMQHISEPFPNGESYDRAVVRVQGFYKELKEKYPDKLILVVGHRATQYGLDVIAGKTLEELLSTSFKWQPYWEYEI